MGRFSRPWNPSQKVGSIRRGVCARPGVFPPGMTPPENVEKGETLLAPLTSAVFV